MEVLGAVSSVIAIVQAVNGLAKGAHFLHQLHGLHEEAASLINRIETLRLFQAALEDITKNNAALNKPEHPVLQTTLHGLQHLLKEIEQFQQSYQKQDASAEKNDTFKIPKRKLVRAKGQIASINKLADQAVSDLQSAVVLFHSSRHLAFEKQLADVHVCVSDIKSGQDRLTGLLPATGQTGKTTSGDGDVAADDPSGDRLPKTKRKTKPRVVSPPPTAAGKKTPLTTQALPCKLPL